MMMMKMTGMMTTMMTDDKKDPYYCSKCGKKHLRGKIWEEHWKYSLSGSIDADYFDVSASGETGTVATTTVSLPVTEIECESSEDCPECCNALWMNAQKTVKHQEGWCEWLPPCGANPGEDYECQGDAVLITITDSGGPKADCSYTNPECTTTIP